MMKLLFDDNENLGSIPAIVVWDAGAVCQGGTRNSPSRLHGRGLLVTHALQPRKMNFYAPREENLFLSRGKYIFLGRKKNTPPVDACPVTRVTWLHGYTGVTCTCVSFPMK